MSYELLTMMFSVVKLIKRIAAVIMIVCIAGCSGQEIVRDNAGNSVVTPDLKYRILSFFFDGVPLPMKQNNDVGDESSSEAPGEKKGPLKYREHGPYAAKLCSACHVPAAGNKLILPVEELCQNCHVLDLNKKKVHGPVVAGGCTICHDPHGSPYRFFLVSESEDFCFFCHDRKDIEKREVHRNTDKGCTYCHNAHAADNEFLLR